ncbi:MAG TPA: hypothetical protein VE077_03020 [Candidatus Methylomirabilis sp.]|nr:hypothetical protein [Candidatus Methylomirabilis sp.]
MLPAPLGTATTVALAIVAALAMIVAPVCAPVCAARACSNGTAEPCPDMPGMSASAAYTVQAPARACSAGELPAVLTKVSGAASVLSQERSNGGATSLAHILLAEASTTQTVGGTARRQSLFQPGGDSSSPTVLRI